jgi:hypothetical protein
MTDLSDDELLQRLLHRGMPLSDAKSWVEYRDAVGAPAQIACFLDDPVEEIEHE